MNSILIRFLMILPFALWGTSMAAMTPLVSSAGPEFVASLRLLPAGILVLITTYLFKRDLKIYKCDLKWFLVFTIVDATFFQLFLTYGYKELPAMKAAPISYIQVFFATIIGIVFFDEQLTFNFLIGSIMVLFSIILVMSNGTKKD